MSAVGVTDMTARYPYQRVELAHMVDVREQRHRRADGSLLRVHIASCRQCDFGGRYPSGEHARVVTDEHIIRSHVSGADYCGRGRTTASAAPTPRCPGCAAIKRKAKRG